VTRRTFTLTLLLLLTIQLTGLTCLEDFQPDISASNQQIHHDCPCHHVVTHSVGITLASAFYSSTIAVPVPQSVQDNLHQTIFRPPLFLL